MFEYVEHGILERPEEEEKWDLDKFKKIFRVENVSKPESLTLEFDMLNVDCSFANALRRMLIAEVPSVAIDRIYMYQNTSVISDETLSLRIALIPLNIDPSQVPFPQQPLPADDAVASLDASSHFLFDFSEKCTKDFLKNDPTAATNKSRWIYSSSLKWLPLPGQEERYSECKPGPVNEKILINKLVLGTELEAKCLAVKGLGRDHAKFQPVSACYYKFHPRITLNERVEGQMAETLKSSFADGVIEIEPVTGVAKVANPRLDNGSREHMRHPELKSSVKVFVDPKQCIFTVESVARPPEKLLIEAFGVMLEKCQHFLAVTDKCEFGGMFKDGDDVSSSLVCGRLVSLQVLAMSTDGSRATFRFDGEDHTLGAALRFCILRNKDAKFCGYCVPHPLEDCIHLEVHAKRDLSAVELLKSGLKTLQAAFEHMRNCFDISFSQL
ncbi:DNA-directed RNA polymerases I and III subunit RPAC1 [Cichlidogyrus casuarinus]|uniref:DNA-directed RNA polymerases I and III subunit RPAC1 n=1 Tax=Cichlidogyrus casuarinus TaxID=1844966 RepID=A0ABD2QFG2_9PLAT